MQVLRLMKYLVTNGHPQFRHSLRKKSQLIAETTSILHYCCWCLYMVSSSLVK